MVIKKYFSGVINMKLLKEYKYHIAAVIVVLIGVYFYMKRSNAVVKMGNGQVLKTTIEEAYGKDLTEQEFMDQCNVSCCMNASGCEKYLEGKIERNDPQYFNALASCCTLNSNCDALCKDRFNEYKANLEDYDAPDTEIKRYDSQRRYVNRK
jgi:hypothetical protein